MVKVLICFNWPLSGSNSRPRSGRVGQVWRSLRTNLSKYTCSFSDFPWPKARGNVRNRRGAATFIFLSSKVGALEYLNGLTG